MATVTIRAQRVNETFVRNDPLGRVPPCMEMKCVMNAKDKRDAVLEILRSIPNNEFYELLEELGIELKEPA